MQTSANEIVAASVVYVSALPVHRPCPKAEWNKPPQMRHFSVVRKIGRKDPFPAGNPLASEPDWPDPLYVEYNYPGYVGNRPFRISELYGKSAHLVLAGCAQRLEWRHQGF
jgi:hypothetical protein